MQPGFQVFEVQLGIKHNSCFGRADSLTERTNNKQTITPQPFGDLEKVEKRVHPGQVQFREVVEEWGEIEGRGRALRGAGGLGLRPWADSHYRSTWRKADHSESVGKQ